ncbi:hypothetical protein BDV36DRAFT_300910 [Aspergillus pseudocaelatus]|uniref:Uncharacterized protein n=1 Tax=Aspergillus pseudocaelatus TaxID=1825620 RepID=A0ABQ6W5N7_9EURO|nr:hypothetical protein BDV36DRAFT_300910 [Aspergillus pseudocaelatus]
MAMILGTESTSLSWAMRPRAACELTTSKPNSKGAISTHTRAQVISAITSLDMVTKDLVDNLRIFCMERVEFKYLKISKLEYENGLDWCDEEYSEITGITMEYNPKVGTVIFNSRGASVLHSSCQDVLLSWLHEIQDSTPEEPLFVHHETEVDGLGKMPDVNLGREGSFLPIIMVEIGFSEALEEMFDSAQEVLHKSKGVTQVVILLKIYEEGRAKLTGHP